MSAYHPCIHEKIAHAQYVRQLQSRVPQPGLTKLVATEPKTVGTGRTGLDRFWLVSNLSKFKIGIKNEKI
jgi:hypothetical protein